MKKQIAKIEALRKEDNNLDEIIIIVSENINDELISYLYSDQIGKTDEEIVEHIAADIESSYVAFRDYANFFNSEIPVYF